MRHRLFAHAYWLIGGLAIVMVLLPVMAPGAFYLRVAALVYINAIAVIGLNLLMGYAGQVSLGHAGFFGIGAYAVGLGPAVFRLPVWASLLAGVALSGVVAFIVGRPILKLRGFYLAVATLGTWAPDLDVLKQPVGPDRWAQRHASAAACVVRLASGRDFHLVLDFRRNAFICRVPCNQPHR